MGFLKCISANRKPVASHPKPLSLLLSRAPVLPCSLALLFLCSPAVVHAGWVPQNSGTGENLNGVSFADADHGFVVGGSYTMGFSYVILRTTNGGAAWTILSSGGPGVGPLYSDVCFVNASTGTVGGAVWGPYGKSLDFGSIIRTTDAGISWRDQGLECWSKSVFFINPDTGTVVGIKGPWNGAIFRTTNGGAVWTSQDSGALYPCFNGVFFADAAVGVIVGDSGAILRTTNGGSTWVTQSSGTRRNLQAVSLIGPDIGIVVGDSGTILHTTNGGAAWLPRASGTTRSLNGVSFPHSNVGTAVGDFGTILRTTDGGITWSPQVSGTMYDLNSVCFTDSSRGTAVGGGGTILHTADGGSGVWQEPSRLTPYASRLTVSPNPFISYSTIPGHEAESFLLYDLSGRLVGTCKGDRIGANLPPGVYFLKGKSIPSSPVRIVKVR